MFGKKNDKPEKPFEEDWRNKMYEDLMNEAPDDVKEKAERIGKLVLSVEEDDAMQVAMSIMTGAFETDHIEASKRMVQLVELLVETFGPKTAYTMINSIATGMALAGNILERENRDNEKDIPDDIREKFLNMTPRTILEDSMASMPPEETWPDVRDEFIRLRETQNLENMFKLEFDDAA